MEEKRDFDEASMLSKFIPLSEASKKTGYTPEYLNCLARKGMLRAQKVGRNWQTREDWLEDFLASSSKAKKDKKAKSEEEVKSAVSQEKKEVLLEDSSKRNDETDALNDFEKESLFQDQASHRSFNKLRFISGAISFLVIVPVIFSGIHGFRYAMQSRQMSTLRAQAIDQVEAFTILNENDSLGVVLGESDTNSAPEEKSKVMLSSENFSIQGISLGGDVILANQEENAPLSISDIRSESFISGKKEEVKLVISWKTNKMAVSDLEYSKNGAQGARTVDEESYGFSHSVVLSGLEPRSSYIYSIKCRDRSGNETGSDYFGIYTASKPVSVFDMIAKALGEVFGWALSR